MNFGPDPDLSVGSDADLARPEVVRKLATIQEIAALDPIIKDGEVSDNIECATVLGWTVVVKKGEFKVHDLCCFFEIDSFLPVQPQYEFLRKSSYRSHPDIGEGFRIKTCKLRGCLSQGLVLPHEELFPYHAIAHEVGTDVTEVLGVRKYDPPIHTGSGPGVIRGDCKGHFPSFVRKTDQERIQNIHNWVMAHHQGEYEATLKVDGTSLTAYRYMDERGVCSRNWDLKEDTEDRRSEYWAIVKKSGLYDALVEINRNIAVQAELMGPGIQRNRENFDSHRFFIFDIWDIDQQRHLTPIERSEMIDELCGWMVEGGYWWNRVPLIEYVTIDDSWTLQKFLEYANRPSINHKIGEGVVFKSVKPNGISFKVINNQFLLKEKD